MKSAIRWLLPLVLLGGCTSTHVAEPLPSAPAVSAVAQPASCPIRTVTVGQAGSQEQMFLNVARRTRTQGSISETELVDSTFSPTLTWQSSPAPDDDEVLAAIVAQADQPADLPTDAPQDNSAALSTMLQSADGAVGSDNVGYTSIVTAVHPVTIACEGGGSAHGTLSTWSDHETGILSCDLKPAKSAAAARAAWDQYCRPE